MSAKLTPAQKRILLAAAKHTHGRVVGGDRRTRDLLSSRGYIEVDGYLYGPLYKITEAGRQAVAPSREGAPTSGTSTPTRKSGTSTSNASKKVL